MNIPARIFIEKLYTIEIYNFFYYFFQETDEGMNNEMNLIVKADIEVDSKEFCDVNDDQANYDGMRWIVICSSDFLMLYRFNVTSFDLLHNYIFILIKYASLYPAFFMCFFCSCRRDGIRL